MTTIFDRWRRRGAFGPLILAADRRHVVILFDWRSMHRLSDLKTCCILSWPSQALSHWSCVYACPLTRYVSCFVDILCWDTRDAKIPPPEGTTFSQSLCQYTVGIYVVIRSTHVTLSPPIPLWLYTLPYWSNPPFLIFDIWTLWHSGLSARAPKCQKLKILG